MRRPYPPIGAPDDSIALPPDAWAESPLRPFPHQAEDAAWLMGRRQALLASQMRTGKTKVVIDAAQFLWKLGAIRTVLVVAPAAARDVWYDPELGQLKANLMGDVPSTVMEYHARKRAWRGGRRPGEDRLLWIVTNYEYVRRVADELAAWVGPAAMLVLDESSAVNSHRSLQTKAVEELRWLCGRVVLMNGTPVFHDPEDLFSQANVMHPGILNCRYVTHFRARYAIEEPVRRRGGEALLDPRGNPIKEITGWRPGGLEELRLLIAPWARRRTREGLGMPARLEPVPRTAEMPAESWAAYASMRNDLVAWLSDGRAAVAATAAAKALRLAQITAGLAGGVEPVPGLEGEGEDRGIVADLPAFKLSALRGILEAALREEPAIKAVVWCSYRREAERALEAIRAWHPLADCAALWGGQRDEERRATKRLLRPEVADPDRPAFVVAVYGTGGFGLDFSAATLSVQLSQQYVPGLAEQAMDRLEGPNQKGRAKYVDVLAVGPRGQRTIDHRIAEARRRGEAVATWTAAAWVKALAGEGD